MGSSDGRVIVITGANRGIGFCLARKLIADAASESASSALEKPPQLTLCLCCRNLQAARAAAESLRSLAAAAFNSASSGRNLTSDSSWCRIDLCKLDTSDFDSVRDCTQWLLNRYKRIDMLYLNAGILLVSRVDWFYLIRNFISREAWSMLTTGLGVLVQADFDCQDGRRGVFKTNVGGHFLLTMGLLHPPDGAPSPLGRHSATGQASRVVWTSSCNASRRHFKLSDPECRHSMAPYAAGKHAIDLLCLHLNRRYQPAGVQFCPVDPGLVVTNLAEGIVSLWFWYLAWPLLCLLRLLVTSYNLTAENGVHALAQVAHPGERLRPDCKYFSRTGLLGRPYMGVEPISGSQDESEMLYQSLLDYAELRDRVS
ncbi:hypothetical protein BOX15_Mlig024157g1 [Macrostomum lignano]|uniref:Hydroxysteroid (17-beta) dehydrogenase 7 n=2 Tax=Macrostomum lignano TaxID=282301 RepID=A0A1I8FW92_9PLAT|nr:hypothetical protein BOX15_Mlig024157g1 [Macrostomum lignano]